MYLIDGYNLLYQFYKNIDGNKISYYREEIIFLIKDYCETKKKKAQIFFDVKNVPLVSLLPIRFKSDYLKVSYVKDADLAILNILENTKDITRYTVISSDRKISSYAQKKGFKVLSSQKFKTILLTFKME
ncbi:MAG: NYN domain-containing protein [candidate division WOR-3 bacterium]|nr:NYN domain-containing protein [candidate division WOR-3 bacterium]